MNWLLVGLGVVLMVVWALVILFLFWVALRLLCGAYTRKR